MAGEYVVTWRHLLAQAMKARKEKLTDLVDITLTKKELSREFNNGLGVVHGTPFTAWSPTAVYFPVCYDGKEWVGSVSRNPDGRPTPHQGG